MPTRERRDSGFTLIEVLVAMTLLGILSAMAVGPWRAHQEARAQQATARLVVSALRNAQVAAVAESVPYRVDVTNSGRSLTVYRAPVTGPATVRKVVKVEGVATTLTGAQFTTSAGTGTSAYFYPRGSASSGRLKVSRQDHSTYTVRVEGLTGRVSLD